MVKPNAAACSLIPELSITQNHKVKQKRKEMKKLLMICGLLFSVVTFAQAQDGGRKMATPEERAQKNAEQLTKKLSLSEDQKAKVTAIFLDQAVAMKKAREENKGGDREAMMAKMKALNDENDVKINALLNDDQKKAFAEWKKERAENMKKRMEGRGPQGGGGQ
jgi:hypothetical protein